MNKNQPKLFSSGIESACLVASSGLLSRSWKVISDINPNEKLVYKVHQESELTIIAFMTSQANIQDDLVSSSDLMDNPFEFLYTTSIRYFSVNWTAISLFNEHRPMLDQLKSQIDVSKPLIVTGHALGGSIASLFTLWLLDSIVRGKRTPFCITFGSPLIGNRNLERAIARRSTGNSCFLHVASHQDPLPSSFTSNNSYEPFGTFLLCSDYGFACFVNPETVFMLLKEMRPINQGLQSGGYGKIVEDLNNKVIFKDVYPTDTHSNALKVSLALQLGALGFGHMQNIDINALVNDMERQEIRLILRNTKRPDPYRKLNQMKISMAQLEWYKKSSKNRGIGYYDSYKGDKFHVDQDVAVFIKVLNNYWKNVVAEAEAKPQKEGLAYRTPWIFGGTSYRRMVEPLDIADYYRSGLRDYMNNGRSEHYKQLEKWLLEEQTSFYSVRSKHNVEAILTIDSCFWAHVEEALISCRQLEDGRSSKAEKGEAERKLKEFEKYVYEQLKNYAVSPEIFLQGSSYMRWWKAYEALIGSSYNSRLVHFMSDPANRERYKKGVCDFP